MKLAEKILRRVYRDRTVFEESELSLCEAIITAYNDERSLTEKKSALPTRFVPIGGEVVVRGRVFRCEAAARVSVPSEACRGCSLSKLYLGCDNLQCSSFDRRDKKFVWFKEVQKA